MAQGVKNRAAFSVAETTYGTAPGAGITGAYSWPFSGDRPRNVPAAISDRTRLTGVYNPGRERVISGYRSEWVGEFDFRMDCFAHWLFRMLGTAAAPTGTGPYTHAITEKQGDTDSFTLYWVDANTTNAKVEAFTGMKAQELEVFGRQGGDLGIRVRLLGCGKHTEETLSMVAQNTDVINAFSHIDTVNLGGTVTWATGAVSSGTSYKAEMEEFSLKIANVFEEGAYGAGSNTYVRLRRKEGPIVTTGGQLVWDENALASGKLMDLAEKSTNKTFTLKVVNSTHNAIINLARLFLTEAAAPGQRGEMRFPFDGEALYDDAGGVARTLSAIITNGRSGQYT